MNRGICLQQHKLCCCFVLQCMLLPILFAVGHVVLLLHVLWRGLAGAQSRQAAPALRHLVPWPARKWHMEMGEQAALVCLLPFLCMLWRPCTEAFCALPRAQGAWRQWSKKAWAGCSLVSVCLSAVSPQLKPRAACSPICVLWSHRSETLCALAGVAGWGAACLRVGKQVALGSAACEDWGAGSLVLPAPLSPHAAPWLARAQGASAHRLPVS